MMRRSKGGMRALALLALATATGARADEAPLIAEPPAARAGECWAVVYIPPRYETRSEQVLKTPATQRVEKIPARYEWVEQTVTVPAGMRRVVVHAAEYEVTEEQVEVTPAGSRQVTVPARYRTVDERVPSRTGAVLKPHPVTGELCVVEGPVEYQVVHRRVLVEPAQSRSVDQPARYKTVRHRKLIKPAETRLVPSQERQVTRRVKQLLQPEWEVRVPVPAVYETQERQVQVQAGRSEWRSVLCETNTTPQLLRRVQQALRDAGHDPGTVDGHWGTQSTRALQRYQVETGLAPAGLSMETLDRLGVKAGT